MRISPVSLKNYSSRNVSFKKFKNEETGKKIKEMLASEYGWDDFCCFSQGWYEYLKKNPYAVLRALDDGSVKVDIDTEFFEQVGAKDIKNDIESIKDYRGAEISSLVVMLECLDRRIESKNDPRKPLENKKREPTKEELEAYWEAKREDEERIRNLAF